MFADCSLIDRCTSLGSVAGLYGVECTVVLLKAIIAVALCVLDERGFTHSLGVADLIVPRSRRPLA